MTRIHGLPVCHSPGRFKCHSVACSKAYAARSTFSSSNGRPMICRPMGSFLLLRPHGSEMAGTPDRKSTRLNSSHSQISYAVFCLKKKKKEHTQLPLPGTQ